MDQDALRPSANIRRRSLRWLRHHPACSSCTRPLSMVSRYRRALTSQIGAENRPRLIYRDRSTSGFGSRWRWRWRACRQRSLHVSASRRRCVNISPQTTHPIGSCVTRRRSRLWALRAKRLQAAHHVARSSPQVQATPLRRSERSRSIVQSTCSSPFDFSEPAMLPLGRMQ
jgi:hypothetical protein